MRKVVLLFVFVLLCVSLAGVVSAASYPGYSAFSNNDGRLSLSGTSLTASDSIVYSTGYYSIGAGAWVPFSFTGDGYLGGTAWLDGSASANLPSFGSGKHYVVMFSCTKGSMSWDCHDMRWQLLVVGEEPETHNLYCGDKLCTASIDETCSNCAIDCGVCPDPGTIEEADYYVAPDGSDRNPGTIDSPWKTWQKAFNEAEAGDLIYFRDGVYYATRSQSINDISGSAGNYIRLWAYPGEKPILDGSQIKASDLTDSQAQWLGGVGGSHANYVHFKGLTVRNYPQLIYNARPIGFACSYCDNMIYENCVAHNIQSRGFYFFEPKNIYVKNCDSYNNVDPWSDTPYNHGDGYLVWDWHGRQETNLNSRVVFEGCRAWSNADDGWDAETEGYIELNNCWAFDQGNFEDALEGNGFKLGLTRVPTDTLARKVVNSIAADNRLSGFTTNDRDCVVKEMDVFNNFGYNNGRNFKVYWTQSSDEQERRRVLRNNLAYAGGGDIFVSGEYTHNHNSWDSDVTVSADDFVSLDTAQLYGARKADGSLPDITFGRLVAGSDLIDAGVDVGLPYLGSNPDMGWFERE